MPIEAETLDDLLRKVLERISRKGTRVTASRGTTKELRSVLLRLTNPRARLSHSERKGKVFSALGELAWYLAESNDANFISYYIGRYKDDMEPDGTIHGAYGPRIFGTNWHTQFGNVVRILRERPSSRQGVIQLFDSGDLAGDYGDVPCTCYLHLFVRQRKLEMIAAMRSNDAFLGLPHDVFSFTMIQELVARALGCELGDYTHFVGSLHLYDSQADDARSYLAEGWQGTEGAAMPPMPREDPMPAVKLWVEAEARIRQGRDVPRRIFQRLNPYWQDLIRLLQIYKLSKDGNSGEIATLKQEMAFRVYRQYIVMRQRPRRTVPQSGQPELFNTDSSSGDGLR